MIARDAGCTTQSAPPPFWLPGAVLQRKCGCGQHTMGGGSCADCKKKDALGLQAKLAVGAADDAYEREADFVAERVMSSSGHGNVQPAALQIQRYAGVSGSAAPSVPDTVGHTLAQSGTPLPRAVRENMEQRFGHDFSQVRVHSGASAAESASDVSAHAYTVGHNIVFAEGRFAPDTQHGQRLLAHELTHVVQQRAGLSPAVQRQPDDAEKEPESDFGKELQKDSLFQKLKKAARDKILEEIDKLPQTVTKAMIDRVIDLAPIDQQYKDGLKKTGDAIIKLLQKRPAPKTSICEIPGYYEGKTRDFKGMCCRGTFESAQTCCPKDKFAPGDDKFCCANNEYVSGARKCEKTAPVVITDPCIPPDKKDMSGKCCKPPFEVIGGVCMMPPKPEPPPQPFSLKFKLGVIDDYNIDQSVLNSRQKPHYEDLKNQIHRFMESCPASIITVSGFADAPGTEEHNLDLGQRRADHIKFLLQLDLIKINNNGMPPFIFARSEGETNPVDTEAGAKFSARNRRVEIEFNSICPPLSAPSLTPPAVQSPWRLNWQESPAGNS